MKLKNFKFYIREFEHVTYFKLHFASCLDVSDLTTALRKVCRVACRLNEIGKLVWIDPIVYFLSDDRCTMMKLVREMSSCSMSYVIEALAIRSITVEIINSRFISCIWIHQVCFIYSIFSDFRTKNLRWYFVVSRKCFNFTHVSRVCN